VFTQVQVITITGHNTGSVLAPVLQYSNGIVEVILYIFFANHPDNTAHIQITFTLVSSCP
jgi:hypothetical protein